MARNHCGARRGRCIRLEWFTTTKLATSWSSDASINGSYDSEGGLYMNCTSLSDNQKSVTKCLLKDEESMGAAPLGLSCYTVFGPNGPTLQGSWIHQKEALSECTLSGRKTNDEKGGKYRFCCCFKHECN